MAVVKPFKGITPKKALASKVASLPYDVMNREEAKEMAGDNPYSFLHIARSEIDLPEVENPYDQIVYETARKNLDRFIAEGTLETEAQPIYYIYRQIMNGRVQTGLVGCTSIDDYMNDVIKKHEFTRPAKEIDRIKNFDHCDANTEPIFLTYRKNDEINLIVNDWIKFHMPTYNFISEDDITHILWKLDDLSLVSRISEIFDGIDYLYIADGHHRSASSVKVGLMRREQYPDYDGTEEFNFFMSVIFPDEDLFIMDYNRVVKDLNGHTQDDYMKLVSEKFDIEKVEQAEPFKPMTRATFGMFIDNAWYKLTAHKGVYDENDPVDRLDVSILQKNLLDPILGIEDPRTNERIDFVGGIRGLKALEKRVSNGFAVAFSMYPTTMDDLIDIANAGEVMPPKSTWFEPKLRSGLFVHRLF
ncbi:DUF1015 domain-containing protein [Fusibacter sp. 3D3]|uniref:DUF1015 domain-containing protein n=1 Tax=Fusibacter sp. 3D3 TaxID=1048380 RepID=UPI000852CBA1|nr:DUF1015 family protein [Fusibacter sp. 3D3]GAU77370.1 related to HTH domain of SpoOJ/ParA/ParB/repB family [Fusibacter sp. 3D3]